MAPGQKIDSNNFQAPLLRSSLPLSQFRAGNPGSNCEICKNSFKSFSQSRIKIRTFSHFIDEKTYYETYEILRKLKKQHSNYTLLLNQIQKTVKLIKSL